VQKELRQEAEQQDSLKVALNLIRSEKYEEAIQKLDELPPADPEVRELKNSTVEKSSTESGTKLQSCSSQLAIPKTLQERGTPEFLLQHAEGGG